MKRSHLKALTVTFLLGISMSLWAPQANAMTENTRILIRGGTYGVLAGTAVGLAVLPLTGNVKGIFIGSSLGLYVGLLMGVYDITHKNDPGNPFRAQNEIPGEIQDDPASSLSMAERRVSKSDSPFEAPAPLLNVAMPVLSF